MEKQLSTKRLTLRKLVLSDAYTLFNYWSDEEVTKFMNIVSFTKVEQAKEMISIINKLSEEGRANRYAIVLKETNQVIGTCGFNYIDKENLRAEIGYDLGKKYWGKGFALEALSELIKYGFSTLQLNRIEAKVEPENINSIKVLNKLFFVKEGLLRKYELSKGEFIDVYMFSLLKSDCPADN